MNARLRPILIKLGSMRLTLVCLGFLMALVFIGTIAQVPMGTYEAQKKFFNSFLVYGKIAGFSVPLYPGGLAIGSLMMVNLISAYALRFPYRRKQAGVVILHLGLIVLFAGQFFTQLLSTESQMPIEIGQSTNFSESSRRMELVIAGMSNSDHEDVTAISEDALAREGKIALPGKSFSIRVNKFFKNADVRMAGPNENPIANRGVGLKITAGDQPPVATDDQNNNTSVYIEVFEGGQSLGVWFVSLGMGAPQSIFAGGNEYSIAIRPIRYYYPFTLKLKEFRHDIYPGTDIPKNFSSQVHLTDNETNESRDALIYMNNPLRYRGHTFYQASFGKNDTLSVLQVVKNPVWLTPYISCVLVMLGMAIQFLTHLTGFLKRKNENASA